jgi:hypothetical protein
MWLDTIARARPTIGPSRLVAPRPVLSCSRCHDGSRKTSLGPCPVAHRTCRHRRGVPNTGVACPRPSRHTDVRIRPRSGSARCALCRVAAPDVALIGTSPSCCARLPFGASLGIHEPPNLPFAAAIVLATVHIAVARDGFIVWRSQFSAWSPWPASRPSPRRKGPEASVWTLREHVRGIFD